MRAILRALPLALGLKTVVFVTLAQPSELPPIFAPRAISAASSRPVPEAMSPPAAAISDRMRKQIAERILAEAVVFTAPVAVASEPITAPPAGSDGPFQMSRFYVKALPLRRADVEPRPVQLWHFTPMDRAERRTQGHSATLWSSLDGNRLFNLNILNGAGKGMDHGRDFTRVEFEFMIRF
jgi:hypothetical protein